MFFSDSVEIGLILKVEANTEKHLLKLVGVLLAYFPKMSANSFWIDCKADIDFDKKKSSKSDHCFKSYDSQCEQSALFRYYTAIQLTGLD